MTSGQQLRKRPDDVELYLWRRFLVREQGEQLGQQQGARAREQEAAFSTSASAVISQAQRIEDAWFEAVAQAYVEAATEVRARHMPWADEFAEAYVHGFLRAYRGACVGGGARSGEGSSQGGEVTKP